MITLKYWNSLSTACRQTIVKIISNECDHDNEIIKPYHHSFDYDITGKKLKAYLSRVFLTKEGKLKIFTELLPTFSPSDDTKLPRWKPKYNKRYYSVSWLGRVMSNKWYGTYDDELGYQFGNIFKTCKEAELVRDKIKKLLNQ